MTNYKTMTNAFYYVYIIESISHCFSANVERLLCQYASKMFYLLKLHPFKPNRRSTKSVDDKANSMPVFRTRDPTLNKLQDDLLKVSIKYYY